MAPIELLTRVGEADPRPRREPGSSHAGLRTRLLLVDVVAVAGAWSVVHLSTAGLAGAFPRTVSIILAVTVATIGLLGLQRLYSRRIATIRSQELVRLARAAMLSACIAALGTWVLGSEVRVAPSVVGFFAVFAALAFARGRFARWLGDQRSAGRYMQRVVIVGDGEEARGLAQLLEECPEAGFRPAGVVVDSADVDAGPDDVDDVDVVCAGRVVALARRVGATGVLISSRSAGIDRLDRFVGQLHAAGLHVHLSSGVMGMHCRRLRIQPIAHEPLLYIEAPSLSRLDLGAKRVLDVVVASVLLLLLAPVTFLAAAAVKFEDGGPVLFRQRRVGRDGEVFEILKLRTMTVDAEKRIREVLDQNLRTGPLFKAVDDPRVTRIGRFLRESSLDEVPQLLNVLRGEMSMVGPRPALPAEVERFDDVLLDRLRVKPGVSGLWQVEARHKASFDEYRRLDLFYVENWSLGLDLAILLATVSVVLRRGRSAMSPGAPAAEGVAPSALPTEIPASTPLETKTVEVRA